MANVPFLGVRAAVDLVVPTGVDATEVFKFESLRTRMTAVEIMTRMATTVGMANEYVRNQYGSVLNFTEGLYAITRQGEGSRTMTPLATEFASADAVRSKSVGHMLPRREYEDALGWTRKYLKESATEEDIVNDLQLIVERFVNRFDYEFWTRMLTDTENAIGSAGYDVGWAIGSGGNVNYIPPQWMGKVFTSSHTHYISNDAWGDLIELMVSTLREHGYTGRLYMVISEDDVSTVAALTNFVKIKPSEVTYVGGNASGPIAYADGSVYEGVPGQLIGFYQSTRGLVEVRYHPRVPQYYAWMTKPYGQGSAQNGPVVRTFPGESFGLIPDVQVTQSINPTLEKVLFRSDFGIGVGNRLNGVAGFKDDGETWVDASIT